MIAWKLALRQAQRRPGRTLLTLLSVLIGVAGVVAVTLATRAARQANETVYESLGGRTDLEVVAPGGSRFDQEPLAKLRQLPGVNAAVPTLRVVTIVYAHGEKAKVLAIGVDPDEPESHHDLEITAGRLPEKGSEVVVGQDLASSLKLEVGETLRLLTSRGLRNHKIVGLAKVEGVESLRQGGGLFLPLAHLQSVFNAKHQVDAIHLLLEDRDQAKQVIAAATAVVPNELVVRMPQARTGMAQDTLELTESGLNMASGLALLATLFIILNTFLMNVGERRKQLSILRAVGATRNQIRQALLWEAIMLGIGGALFGVPLGVLGAAGLTHLLSLLLGAKLAAAPVTLWSVGVGLTVGVITSLVGALYPAHIAASVSPLEGMRAVAGSSTSRSYKALTILGVAGIIGSTSMLAVIAKGWLGSNWAILQALLSLVSVVMLLPAILPGFARLILWPWRWLIPFEGQVAERQILRHATRTTLTVGVLFVVVSTSIGMSNSSMSIRQNVHRWYDSTFTADYLVRTMMPDMSGETGTPMPDEFADELAKIPGVTRVDPVCYRKVSVNGMDAVLVARTYSLYPEAPMDLLRGDPKKMLQQLRAGEVGITQLIADRNHVSVGDAVEVSLGTNTKKLKVAGVANEYTFGGSVVYVEHELAKKWFNLEGVDTFLIQADPAKASQVKEALKAFCTKNSLLLQSAQELAQIVFSTVNSVTGGTWVLLVIGLLIGGFGVVNTLTMNVLEQTRELGVLRVVGMQRGQLYRTVLWQALIVAALGLVGGCIAGVIIAYAMNWTLELLYDRTVPFALRPLLMGVWLVLALVMVMIAALVPARRASRISLLEAVRYE